MIKLIEVVKEQVEELTASFDSIFKHNFDVSDLADGGVFYQGKRTASEEEVETHLIVTNEGRGFLLWRE